MSIPFWDPVPTTAQGPKIATDPWDVVTLAGVPLPGICKIEGLPALAFDKKKAGGVDGATITVNGYLPGPITIECTIWTDEQWQYFQSIADKIWRKPNKKTKAADLAIGLVNPRTDLWGITSVVVLGVTPPVDGSIEGTKVIKIKCVEYVPTEAKSKTKTAKGSVTNVGLDEKLLPARNIAGDSPSKNGIHPKGPPKETRGGSG